MAEDPLHDIIEAVSARLKTEVETQLHTVSERQRQALEEQRARIETEAEQLWAPQLQAARTEVEQQAVAAAAAKAALSDLEQLWSRERALAESRLAEERRIAADGQNRDAAVPTEPPNISRLLQGLRDVDAAGTVSESLTAVLRAARSEANRSALYVANGSRLEQWAADNGTTITPLVHDVDPSNDSIAVDAFRRTEVVRKNGTACAIPLLLDGAAVAVLYGESDPEASDTAAWQDHLEAVARHGAARVGYLTAVRTTQARQLVAESASRPSAGVAAGNNEDTTASAKRYARLVVSEVKLYNESAVQEGRNRRDLLTRLGPEIDRARRLYEERVPASVPDRSAYFQQELIQTLAGGDPSLLG